ncbi:MAG: fumarylacetoacetate hydrolase family protein [Bacteroidota bacterium]
MIVAQFYDRTGPHVGLRHRTGWIDYGKARALDAMLKQGTPVEEITTVTELLERGLFSPDEFRRVVNTVIADRMDRAVRIATDAKMGAPLRRPRKIVALGLNYARHAKEGNFAVPKEPIIFMKAGSSVIGPDDTVRIPRGMGRMDHEVELAAVIGSEATRVAKRDAWKHVAGYTICNDVTARDVQTKDLEQKHPWFRSKSFDTFTPLGPWIVTADEFPRSVHLTVECRVNGRIRQKANTRNLVFDIPRIIEFVSRHITLEAGDVISTGTPEGIGPIVGGDMMECRIERIGVLRNPVRWR